MHLLHFLFTLFRWNINKKSRWCETQNQLFAVTTGSLTIIFLRYNQLIVKNKLFQDILTFLQNACNLSKWIVYKKTQLFLTLIDRLSEGSCQRVFPNFTIFNPFSCWLTVIFLCYLFSKLRYEEIKWLDKGWAIVIF